LPDACMMVTTRIRQERHSQDRDGARRQEARVHRATHTRCRENDHQRPGSARTESTTALRAELGRIHLSPHLTVSGAFNRSLHFVLMARAD
jgi:hypothetical protein